MFVAIQHQISNPKEFWKSAKNVIDSSPKGLKVHSVLKGKDGTKAVCLWECDTVDNLRSFIEKSTGDIATNNYFEVDVENSIGLPASKAAA